MILTSLKYILGYYLLLKLFQVACHRALHYVDVVWNNFFFHTLLTCCDHA
jgi:hypothetical protein